MKTLKLLILFTLLISASCKNDDDTPTNPIDQLPPATQTGENTFGCLLNGEAFLPGPGPNTLDAVYQFVNGGYFFALQANKRDENNNAILIGILTDDLQIEEMETYALIENEAFNASGTLALNASFNYTTQIHTGELTITKLDFDNNIVSGTFWYDIEDTQGIIHQIREGRFDMRFTQ